MPSLIAAPTSTHSKLAIFNGLIDRAGIILPPVFISTVGALSYLAYNTLGDTRTGYLVAAGSLLAALGLQVVILPKNKVMQDKLRSNGGEAASIKQDDGREGSALISEVLYWNWGRVLLSLVAFGAVLYAAENSDGLVSRAGNSIGNVVGQSVEPMLAARKLEYGLE